MQDYEIRHLETVRKAAPECMVLLKRKGDLPFKETGKLALFGSGARFTIKGGTGSGDVNSRSFLNIEQGLEQAGFTITTKAWLDQYDACRKEAEKQFFEDIKKQAKAQHRPAIMVGMGKVMTEPEYQIPMEGEGDTAVYVLSRNSGEGNDRVPEKGDIKLTDTEARDILAANEKYEHFVLVLNVGGPVDLSPVKDVSNILLLSQIGAQTAEALADVLTGKSYPSGKLATTWAKWEDYPSIGEFGGEDETRYKEGIYVGYRYFDTAGVKPMYPFGYGLGYTDFEEEVLSTEASGTKILVKAKVTNTGHYAGKEVIQVYVSVPEGKLDQPAKTLAAFAKTKELQPGESDVLNICFDLVSIASFDTGASAFVLEAGSYVVLAGKCSACAKAVSVIELAETVTIRKVEHVGGTPDFQDWKPAERPREVPADLPDIKVDAKAFEGRVFKAASKVSEKAKTMVKLLSDEQLVYLCLGDFRGGGIASVIGSASSEVAGAAGQTDSRIESLPPLVMADGPAGLRLSKDYVRDAKGAHSIGSAMPAGMEELLPDIAKFFMHLGDKKPKGEVLHQYCTAIPIGTALAQSWNPAVAEACGDIAAAEMELFNVDLWLAPALNIHRSPLCGRNFEYYSEDPLISGEMAAAITRGVQKHPGKGVTIKHFCANNQETNRYCSNSQISERALREIYLRGFKICIDDAAPAALMTSYNLLNGIHTSERKDLMITLLRDEWGYEGLIMTDWVISMMGAKGKHRMANAPATLAGGNELFMPGGQGDFKKTMKALSGKDKEFRLTREELEYCAARVVDAVMKIKNIR